MVYDAITTLTAWIDPLGIRTTYLYDPASSTSSVTAVVQPLGQRTTFALTSECGLQHTRSARTGRTVESYPTLGRTTITLGVARRNVVGHPQPGRQSHVVCLHFAGGGTTNTLGYLNRTPGRPRAHDHDLVPARRHRHRPPSSRPASSARSRSTSTSTTATTSSRPWSTSWATARAWCGTALATGSPSSTPTTKRTSYVYDSMARLVAVQNALGLRATQVYDSQGRLSRRHQSAGLSNIVRVRLQ